MKNLVLRGKKWHLNVHACIILPTLKKCIFVYIGKKHWKYNKYAEVK